jgi:hypothetical protein
MTDRPTLPGATGPKRAYAAPVLVKREALASVTAAILVSPVPCMVAS